MNVPLNSLLMIVLAANFVAGNGTCTRPIPPAKDKYNIRYELGGGAGHYNYAPSVIQDQYGIRYAFMCENKNAFEIIDYIYLYKGIPTANGYVWQPGTEIVAPSSSGWDKIHICDPDVRRYDLTYKGEKYQWVMTYLGVDQWHNHNQIGLAISKNIEGPYIKYDQNPFIPFTDTTQWGVGQTSSIVLNDSIMRVFYSRSAKPKRSMMCMRDVDIRNLDNPIIGEEKVVPHLYPNTFFAASKNNIYAVSELWINQSKEIPTWVGNHVRFVYKPISENLHDTADRWREIAMFGPNETRFPRNHNPGFLTDDKGYMLDEEQAVIYFTVAMTGSNWLWSYDLYSATIQIPK
jgi:hypothetical protein